MFQRTQTVFLLVALVAIASTFFIPIASYGMSGKTVATYTNYGLVSLDAKGFPVIVSAGFNYLGAAAALVSILFCLSQFKRRKLQIIVCRVIYVLLMFQGGYNFATLRTAAEKIKIAGQTVDESYGLAFYMPIVALLFVLLAERFIKRDEELVKSADRLR